MTTDNPMPGTVTVDRFTVRYSGAVRDFYRAVLPGITSGVGPSAELAVADVLRNYAAEYAASDETGRTELRQEAGLTKPEFRTALTMWEAAVTNAHGGALKTPLLTVAQLIEAGDKLAEILRDMTEG